MSFFPETPDADAAYACFSENLKACTQELWEIMPDENAWWAMGCMVAQISWDLNAWYESD